MKILLISDVHGNIKLMDQIIAKNSDCEFKFYMGDFDLNDANEEKKQGSKFDKVVTGNCDVQGISPMEIFVELNNLKIMILHGHTVGFTLNKKTFKKMRAIAKENGAKLILHGHDHIDANETKDGITRFNPGSITSPKGDNGPSYGILEIEPSGLFSIKHIYL